MSITVMRTGILDTVQDTGRYGYGKWGVNPGGAMDRFAAQAGNALVGNQLSDAVIELHFPSGAFLFNQDALISLTGADFSPHVDGIPIPPWKPVLIRKSSVLTFRHRKAGARCYLCLHGGVDVPRWLGSASTNLKIASGGFNGRSLRKGDELRIGAPTFTITAKELKIHPWAASIHEVYKDSDQVSFVEGHEFSWLDESSRNTLTSQPYTIASSSDRMAYHLNHVALYTHTREELLSSAVSFGTIQLLPNGNLLVLMADHQTTGGYPRVGHIISAHHPKLAQLSHGERFYLHKVSMADAEKLLFSLHHDLQVMQDACRAKLQTLYGQH